MNDQKLSIIIPCYNEGQTVGAVVRRVLAVDLPGWTAEVIAVNDGSTDGTAEALKGLITSVERKNFRVVDLAKNGGKGTAVKEGLKVSTGDFAIIQDADFECDPEEIPLLLRTLEKEAAAFRKNGREGKVAVIGSRELGMADKRRFSLSRTGSLSITKLINLLYGSKLTDASMCYKLFPRAAFSLFDGGGFEAELLFVTSLLRAGYHIVEAPVSYHPRSVKDGKKIKYRHGMKTIANILWTWLVPTRSR